MPRSARDEEHEGVIFRVRDFADSHRIIEVLTPDQGRISLLARGGRASRRRFRGALDLFVSLRMQCIRAAGLWTLHAADVFASRYAIRSTLEGLQRATVLCECARLLATEHQAMPALYESLTRGLDCLDAGDGVAAAREYPRLLRASGIAPDPRVCARCAKRDPDRVALDVQVTGLMCATCASGQPTLPAGVWWGEPVDLGASDVEALEWSVVAWIEHHVGRLLKSRALMTKV